MLLGIWRGSMVRRESDAPYARFFLLNGEWYIRFSDTRIRAPEPNINSLLFIFGQVLSSIIAAWTDISNTYASLTSGLVDTGTGVAPLPTLATHLHGGYIWMFLNCVSSAGYVRSSPVVYLFDLVSLCLRTGYVRC